MAREIGNSATLRPENEKAAEAPWLIVEDRADDDYHRNLGTAG